MARVRNIPSAELPPDLAAICGFFNKFNDALGIEEESEAVGRLAAISACAE
jgi:hypothetical protein